MTKKSRDRRKRIRRLINKGWKKIDTIYPLDERPILDWGKLRRLSQEEIEQNRCKAYRYLIP